MNTYKKVLLGFLTLILITSSIFIVFLPKKAFAVPVSRENIQGAAYYVQSIIDPDGGNPELDDKIALVWVQLGDQPYTFSDNDTTNNDLRLGYYGQGLLCNSEEPGEDREWITYDLPGQRLPGGAIQYSARIGGNDFSGDTDEDCREGSAQEFIAQFNGFLVYDPTQTQPLPPPLPPPGTTARSCLDADKINLGWFFCKILNGIDGAVNGFYKLVEDQLCFKAGPSSTGSGERCPGTNFLQTTEQPDPPGNGVYRAWSVFRNIATALLVIAMLMMVLSQALNFGPLDAYTVRKLLPRLVAVAILIQLSWVLTIFTIDIFNDIGRGLAELMYAPFGGRDAVDIDNALRVISRRTQVAILFTGLFAIGLVAFSGLTVVGLLLLALPVILAVIIGYLVLLFRQILIILCVIFVPIALIMWILPGTERYWKLWRETFIKLMMMFPLIVALIAAGKIFGTLGGAVGGVTGFIIVLVGFFGPLLILPKTFNWGGQALGVMGGAVINGTRGLRRKPAEYAMGGAAKNRQFRGIARAEQLADRSSRFGAVGRGWNSMLAGKYNPAMGGATRQRQFEATLAQGRKESEEAAVRALVGSRYESLSHPLKLEDLDDRAQGLVGRHSGIDGSNTTARLLALDQLAEFGDWDRITRMRSARTVPESVWERFTAKNISAINQQAPHLSPLSSKADLSQAGYEDTTIWKDESFEEARRAYDNAEIRYTGEDDPSRGLYKGTMVDVARARGIDPTAAPEAAGAARQEYRSSLAATALSAVNDSQVSRRISTKNLRDLQHIAGGVGGPEVQVLQDRSGRAANVVLPTTLSTPEARVSIVRHLSEGGPAASQVRDALAERVAAAPAGSSDETGFVGLMGELRAQAATSPQARAVHNSLLDRFHTELENRAQAAEGQALGAGHSAADIDTTVELHIQHGAEKIDRLGLGDRI